MRGPHDQTVVEGSAVTFQCRVGGDPMPDVLWRRTASGGNMPLGNLISYFCVGSVRRAINNIFDNIQIYQKMSIVA